MNRYKIKKADYVRAKTYLAGNGFKKDSPSWAVKFKDILKFKGQQLYYNGSLVVPEEDVDTYLRDKVYNKLSEMPLSRDGAYNFVKKQNIIGISRTRLMKFLRAQPAIVSVRSAKNKPKSGGGVPVKNYNFSCDLVFVRKDDLVAANPRFEDTVDKKETYIVSVIENVTGITRLGYTKTKDQHVVTPIVVRLIKSIAQQLGIDPKNYSGSSDAGGEFGIPALQKVVKNGILLICTFSVSCCIV